MVEVQLSGDQFAWPNRCACCGGMADARLNAAATRVSGTRVVHTQTNQWSVPYCQRCLAHLSPPPSEFGCAGVLLTLVSGGLYLIVHFALASAASSRRRAFLSATCATESFAVRYLGWHGSVHRFLFASPVYAVEFARANRRKLINAHPALLQIVDRPQPIAAPAAPMPYAHSTSVAIAPAPRGHPDDETFARAVKEIEAARGPATRVAALDKWLPRLAQPYMKERLMLEAARIDVRAVLDKVDSLKSAAAKRRHLLDAIDRLRTDAVPDHLQTGELLLLEAALRAVDAS